ncbi:MAG: HAMP domain-containing sensor histidine kinase [Kineosporiaceae bacterium]
MAEREPVDVTPQPVDVTPQAVDVTPEPVDVTAGAPAATGGPPPAPWTRALDGLGRLSLQTRLLAVLVVMLVSCVGLAGMATQIVITRYLDDQADADLLASARMLSGNPQRLNRMIQQTYSPEIPSLYYVVVTLDASPTEGRPNRAPDDEVSGEQADVPSFPAMTSRQARDLGPRIRSFTAPGGTHWRAVTLPVSGNAAVVTVAVPRGDVESTADRLRLLVVISGLMVVALGALLGRWAIGRSFRPLREMEDTAAAIAAGDLSRRVPHRAPSTEVGRLGAALNGMLAQIERAFHAREASESRTRRFAADASHELRTPVTAIRGFAELYRQGAVKDPDDVARVMRRIEDEATRMGSLVEDLLLLARLDERRPAKLEEVDLAVLAADAVHDARAMDRDRTVSLVGVMPGTGPRPTVVTGDNHRLRQVLANLVANALRHTPAGTPVEVAVGVYPHASGDFALLEVRDHGGGVPASDVERVFERFYRVDASRQRAKGGGSGLGLSIVAAVVEQHGGRVDLVETPGGGATFRVSLPLRAGQGADDAPEAAPRVGSSEVIAG